MLTIVYTLHKFSSIVAKDSDVCMQIMHNASAFIGAKSQSMYAIFGE